MGDDETSPKKIGTATLTSSVCVPENQCNGISGVLHRNIGVARVQGTGYQVQGTEFRVQDTRY